MSDTRSRLSNAAISYAAQKDSTTGAELVAAAEAHTKAVWAAKAPPVASGLVMPFGKTKGTPIAQCDDRDLKYLLRVLPESIADDAKSQWRTKNEELLAAVESEMSRR